MVKNTFMQKTDMVSKRNITGTCNCISPVQQLELSKLLPSNVMPVAEDIPDADVNDAQTISLKLRFIVLQGTVDIATDVYIADNVRYLNEAVSATNFSELSMIPVNFKETIGDANMVFIVENIVKVENVNEKFSSLRDVVSVFGEYATGGNINVFVCDLQEPLLGEAFFGGNVMCIHNATVGSPTRPNFYGNTIVNRGKTLVHELGHCLGLLHTFTNGKLCVPVFQDIPAQQEPNGAAQLIYNPATGTFFPWLDNRRRDCEAPKLNKENSEPPYSCLSKLNLTCGQSFVSEAFFNFMDYTNDMALITFSNDQCDSMRKFVKKNMGIFGATLDTPLPAVTSAVVNTSKVRIGPEWLVAVVTTILVFVFLVVIAVVATYNSI